MSLKDSSLLLNRADPEAGPLLPRENARYGEALIRHAFLALDDATFRFHPLPFGSVFLFSHPDAAEQPFDFVDVPAPYWALAIRLPSNKTLAVLFADHGVTKRITRRYAPLKAEFEKLPHHVPDASARYLLFALLRWQVWLDVPSRVRLTDHGVFSDHIPRRIRTHQVNLTCYRQIDAYCGLPDVLAQEAFSRDQDALRVPYLLCR